MWTSSTPPQKLYSKFPGRVQRATWPSLGFQLKLVLLQSTTRYGYHVLLVAAGLQPLFKHNVDGLPNFR